MAVVFHGVTELAQILEPGRNFYRELVPQEAIDDWALTASIAILCFAGAYCGLLWLLGRKATQGASPVLAVSERPPVDWRLALAALIPLYLMGVSMTSEYEANVLLYGYFRPALVDQFLLLVTILASYSYIIQKRGGHVFRVLVIQSFALTLLGERLNVIIGVVVLMGLLARSIPVVDRRARTRQVIAALGLTAVLIVAISASRVVIGRAGFSESTGQRFDTLLASVDVLERKNQVGPEVADDFIYRFDGNSFAALVDDRMEAGWEPTGGASLASALLVAVPQPLYKDKIARPFAELNEEQFMLRHFGMDTTIDWTPTLLGTIFTYNGAALLWFLSLVFGGALAFVDDSINRHVSLKSLLVGLGLAYSILYYERTTEIYFQTARGCVAIALVVTMVAWVGRALAPEPHPSQLA